MSLSLETYALCKKYTDSQVGGGSAITGTMGTITLGTSWTAGSNGVYTQTVTATGYIVTRKTRVDLVADAATIAQLVADGVTQIYISNDNATLTAVALSAPLSVALTLNAVFSEVKE